MMKGIKDYFRSIWRFQRFDSPELEERFEEAYRDSAVQASRLWAMIQFPIATLNACGAATTITPPRDVFYWTMYIIYPLAAIILFALTKYDRLTHVQLRWAAATALCITTVAWGVQMVLFVITFQRHGYGIVLTEDAAGLVNLLVAYMLIFLFYCIQQMQVIALLHTGYCPSTLLACLSGPAVLLGSLLVLNQGLGLPLNVYFTFPAATTVASVELMFAMNVSNLRRSMFLLETQKIDQSHAAHRADGMVNHILKNVLVEAHSHLSMFLDLCMPPPPANLVHDYLGCAMERLLCGMDWCKRRKVVSMLADRNASPNPATVDLRKFCSALINQRPVNLQCPAARVRLDEALMDLMLENVLSNAFRHGHPTDPDVRFVVTVEDDGREGGSCLVTFAVSNRANSERRHITPELLSDLLDERNYPQLTTTTLSEGFGLRHCYQAACLQGIQPVLRQDREVVTFEATLATTLVLDVAVDNLVAPELGPDSAALPAGLCVCVIDDSAAARRLLSHQLTRDLDGCRVFAFGQSEADVEPFLTKAIACADIVILDQNLDWPSGNPCFGTDLVSALLRRNFRGLICIRSANTAEHDVAQYEAAGVHCVLDKLLDRARMVGLLRQAFGRLHREAMYMVVSDVMIESPSMALESVTDAVAEMDLPGAIPSPNRRVAG